MYAKGYNYAKGKRVKKCRECDEPAKDGSWFCLHHWTLRRAENHRRFIEKQRALPEEDRCPTFRTRKIPDGEYAKKYDVCISCNEPKEQNEFAMHEECWQKEVRLMRNERAPEKEKYKLKRIWEVVDKIKVMQMHHISLDFND